MTLCAVLPSMSEGHEICVSGCREHATAQSPRSLCLDREATSTRLPSRSRRDVAGPPGRGGRLPVAIGAPWCSGCPARRRLPFDHAHGLWQDRPRMAGGAIRAVPSGATPGGDGEGALCYLQSQSRQLRGDTDQASRLLRQRAASACNALPPIGRLHAYQGLPPSVAFLPHLFCSAR